MTRKEFETDYNTWEDFRALCDWLEAENYSSACVYIYDKEEVREDIIDGIRKCFHEGCPFEDIVEMLRKIEIDCDYFYGDYDTRLQYRGLTEADLPEFKERCLNDLEEANYPWDRE